ncbi:MAG: hypothetical protein H6735_10500 [Alphaproteobacteria bacterium]|nr:hypothetical protein [Alphaproteobacteria bacterium]
MKAYEKQESGRRHLPLLPICARIDGRSFSRFTRGLRRPYDERLSELMVRTTEHLVEQTQARVGYTQSDEISLVLLADGPKSQTFLDGRVQKLTSLLAAMATGFFVRHLDGALPEKAGQIPVFDCRTWTVPTREEAVAALLWRQQDATKNAVAMAARHHYAHGELHGRSAAQMQEMLFAKGVNFNDYPTFFKRGTWVRRQTTSRRLTADELAALPPKHRARTDPDLMIERTEIVRLDLPPLTRVPNRVEVVLEGVEPRLADGG